MIQASHPKMNFNEEPGKQKSPKVIKKKKRRRIVQCRYRKRKLSQEIKKKWRIQESMVLILITKSVILKTQNVSSLATLEKHGIEWPTKETKGKQSNDNIGKSKKIGRKKSVIRTCGLV